MKRCPRCAERIQNGASICRYCSAAQPAGEGGNGTLVLVSLGIVLFIGTMNSLTGRSDSNSNHVVAAAPSRSADDEARAAADAALQEASEELDGSEAYKIQILGLKKLESVLRDPVSMETRNVRVPAGTAHLCGEVNSRNGFGGMTGYRRFIAGAATGMPTVVEGEGLMAAAEFDASWERLC